MFTGRSDDAPTIRRMCQQCYRDVMSHEGEVRGRKTAQALYERLTGEDGQDAIGDVLRDAWMLGLDGNVSAPRQARKGFLSCRVRAAADEPLRDVEAS